MRALPFLYLQQTASLNYVPWENMHRFDKGPPANAFSGMNVRKYIPIGSLFMTCLYSIRYHVILVHLVCKLTGAIHTPAMQQ